MFYCHYAGIFVGVQGWCSLWKSIHVVLKTTTKGGKTYDFNKCGNYPIWYLFPDSIHRWVIGVHFLKAKEFENSLLLVSCLSTDYQQVSNKTRFSVLTISSLQFLQHISFTIMYTITRTILGLRHQW